jgi:hypothetical protein
MLLLLALAVVMATSACPYSARMSAAIGKSMPEGHIKPASGIDHQHEAVAPGSSRKLKVGCT